jgi:hypothetical protein
LYVFNVPFIKTAGRASHEMLITKQRISIIKVISAARARYLVLVKTYIVVAKAMRYERTPEKHF